MAKMVRIRVAGIEGECPVHSVGDQFFIDGPSLVSEGPVCIHALPTLIHYGAMLREGADPVELGLAKGGRAAFVACPDPGPPLTDGGTVIFEIGRMR
jgi:uncharacterized repeat protein (TIGR04076 family)